MINVMHALNRPMNQLEKSLDPELWHACAGGMAQIPSPNSKVYYFPQGHFEHANSSIDFTKSPKIPPFIPCKVALIKYLADPDTDEVYAKIRLIPLRGNEFDCDENGLLGLDNNVKNDEKDKPNSFAKTLTQSDANNGGGFSVPRYCAETIFPRLDYSAEPPVQTILVKDVHGEIWKFRHIYRGTPRRHLLTTGWSNFVNQKKLVAGDSIVFLRAENGDLCVGVRRSKVGIGGGPDISSGWNTGFSGFLSGSGNSKMGSGNSGNVRGECVVEAARLAARGEVFEVVYYPRASTPEFVVRETAVRAAMRVQWCAGMRFKMAFETEDSSRISWFMGTISSVQVDDPIRWPNSPWRLLQVSWDEPELLHNVKRVNPWLVELVSSIPAVHLSHFSPPRKRARVPQPPDFPPFAQHQFPPLLTNPLSPISPLCCLLDNISSGVQGARQARFGSSPPSDLHFKKLQPFDFKPLNYGLDPLSCSLQIGNSSEKNDSEGLKPVFLLFGQPILTEKQISRCFSDGNQENMANGSSNGSGSLVIQSFHPEASSDEEFPRFKDRKHESGFETGHCKVFVESEDVGRTLDLSIIGSYDELYKKLAAMFGMETSDMSTNVVYSDEKGTTKHTGDESFSDFTKNARRLTILTDSGSVNLGN